VEKDLNQKLLTVGPTQVDRLAARLTELAAGALDTAMQLLFSACRFVHEDKATALFLPR
jgi:hypothetical protein